MNIKKNTIAFLLGSTFISGAWGVDPVNPIEDGTGILSDTSKDSLQIDMEIKSHEEGGSVLIQNLDDLNLGIFEAGADLSASSNFCIYATGAESTFDIDVQIGGGDTGEGNFELTGKSNPDNKVNYSVKYAAGLDAKSSSTSASAGKDDHTFSGLKRVGLNSSFQCASGGDDNSGNNASIYVSVSTQDASVAPADEYTGTLTLVVSAN